jgi:NADH:quinone reductase (non-electrogenic)
VPGKNGNVPTKRILILGGGFAGLAAAVELDKTIAADADVEVTVVNRENFFLFTPMLHEVAAGDLDLTTIVNPARKMLQRARFFAGEVQDIDLASQKAVVTHGFDHHSHTLEYDFLVLGLGSVTNFYGLPGLQERALTMKSLNDAMRLRNHIIAHLEEADSECCQVKTPLLTFVVAGGGFAGVETIAGINDFVRGAIRSYRHLREDMLRVVLVDPGAVILPELHQKLGRYTQTKLAERQVEIRLNTKVEELTEQGIRLSDGTTIRSNTLVWTAGTSPNPLLKGLPCQKDRGRVIVNEYFEVPGYTNVWAVGDCAAVPNSKTGTYHPPTAQHALRQGKILARNIGASIRGGEKEPFTFTTIGQLAAIGRRTGVANIMGINFSGFLAWWLWRTIYLSKLPRLEKKVRVALDWALDLIFSKDLVQFLDIRAPVHVESTAAAGPEIRTKVVGTRG